MIKGPVATGILGLLVLFVGAVSGVLNGLLIIRCPPAIADSPVPWLFLSLCSAIFVVAGVQRLLKGIR